jgi:hypothetical protein
MNRAESRWKRMLLALYAILAVAGAADLLITNIPQQVIPALNEFNGELPGRLVRGNRLGGLLGALVFWQDRRCSRNDFRLD